MIISSIKVIKYLFLAQSLIIAQSARNVLYSPQSLIIVESAKQSVKSGRKTFKFLCDSYLRLNTSGAPHFFLIFRLS